MEMIRVGICLDDDQFAQALSIGLARTCRSMTFTLLSNLTVEDEFDLYLISDDMEDYRRLHFADNPRIITMVRDEERVRVYDGPPYCVYRYKDSDHLINDLLFIYFKISGKNLELIGETKCKPLVFASVSGGNGCTLTSLSVGQMLYKLYGCKCLYLNLCPIDDSKKYLPAEDASGLLNLLYYLDIQKNFPLGSFITQTNLIDYIHTDVVNTYFDELNFTLLNRLLKKIDEIGVYSFLLIDISNHLSRNLKRLLNQASRTILLYQDRDRYVQPYFSLLLKTIQSLAGEDRLILVRNFADLFSEEEMETLTLSREKHCEAVRCDGLLDFSQMSFFQRDAGALARTIMEELS